MHMHQDSISPCICTTIRKTARAVAKVYDEALAGSGMTTAQFSILRRVARAEPLALSRLAEQLVMDRSSLYRALAPITAKGWVLIEPGPGKAKLARLSDQGRAAMAGAEGAWEAMQARMTRGMGGDFWTGMEFALKQLESLAKRAGAGR